MYQADLYHETDEDFRKLRYEFLEKINNFNPHENLLFQIPGIKWNKWKSFYEFSQAEWELSDSMLRFPMNNEIIIDIDKKELTKEGNLDVQASINSSLNIALSIMSKLNKENLNYSLYFSGNKGWHIKILIKNFNIDQKLLITSMKLKSENSLLFIKLVKEGFLKYFNLDIGLDSEMCIDPCLLNKKQLVRTEGSLHDKSQKWKSYINKPYNKSNILNQLKKFNNMTRINFNYLNEQNILSKELSLFIFEHVKSEFTELLKRKHLVNKYKNKNSEEFNEKNLYGYIEAFKEIYTEGRRFIVSPAIISFFYMITNKDKEKSLQYWKNNFLSLTDNENQFYSIFERVWQVNSQAEKISIYSYLETNKIISKEDFKERVKFINFKKQNKSGENLDNR